MTSIWKTGRRDGAAESAPVEVADRVFEVAIVGAGITGLATALMLLRAGRNVVVVEAREVAALASGANTGKAALLQGDRLRRIRRAHSARVTRAYVEANLDGQRWIADTARELGVPFGLEPEYSYAQTPEGLDAVDGEYDAAREAGLPVERIGRMPAGFPFEGAVVLADQLALDPVRLADALAAEFLALGGTLLTGVTVTGVHASDPAEVATTHGTIRADDVVVATAAPILNRGLYFAKTRHSRSYLSAFRGAALAVPGLYLSVDSPGRSIRTTPDPAAAATDAAPLLIVGGGAHAVGRATSPAAGVREYEDWTREHFPGAERVASWSAQDYISANLVPFVGRMPRGNGRIWVATGYAKWGLTNGVAAAIRIASEILGSPWREQRSWIRVLGTRVTVPSDLGRGAAENAAVARELAKGWAGVQLHPAPARKPAEGEGVVVSRGGVPYGVSTVEGRTCAVRAVCTHLGGVLRWNDAEASWDCPLHGSRFEASGRRIEGPAVRDLPTAERSPRRS